MQMRNQKTRILVFLLLAFLVTGLEAQQAIPVAGGEANGTGGTVSYTFGQVWYTTISGNGISIHQGVQQPFEILEITGIHSNPGITIDATLYPNPAGEFINLEVTFQSMNGLSYQLYNMQGELLITNAIERDVTKIPVSQLGSAPYLLKITDSTVELKAFKIIKK